MILNARPHRILLNILLLFPLGWRCTIFWDHIGLHFLVLAQFGLHSTHQNHFPPASTCWISQEGELGFHCWEFKRHLVVPCLVPELYIFVNFFTAAFISSHDMGWSISCMTSLCLTSSSVYQSTGRSVQNILEKCGPSTEAFSTSVIAVFP